MPPSPGRSPAKSSARKPSVTAPSEGLPAFRSLAAVRRAAADCQRCDLWRAATQTVFGEGPARARVMVIGEQPGDQEDLSGHPFVGPSGQLFDRALEQLGIDRDALYVTNAVKHFKFERRGKARLHQRPDPGEQRACRVWLDAERRRIRPDTIVCLGAIAAKAVLGSGFALMRQRGQWQVLDDGTHVLATVHPSFVLRQRGSTEREAVYAQFVSDLAHLRDRGL